MYIIHLTGDKSVKQCFFDCQSMCGYHSSDNGTLSVLEVDHTQIPQYLLS